MFYAHVHSKNEFEVEFSSSSRLENFDIVLGAVCKDLLGLRLTVEVRLELPKPRNYVKWVQRRRFIRDQFLLFCVCGLHLFMVDHDDNDVSTKA